MPERPAGTIPLIPISPREVSFYRLFVLSSLVLAAVVGFLLGLHIPLGRLLDWQSEARRPDIIQVHGQVQLLGFAGLFVMGMSLRLVPRFAGARLRFEGMVLPIWCLVAGSLAIKGLVMVWLPDGWHSALAIATGFGLFLGGGAYFLVVSGTLLLDQERVDASGWLFLLGAAFFFLQGGVATFIAVQEAADDTRVFSYLPNMALLYMQLGGFLIAFIAAVAMRALPTMSGRPRPDAGAKRVCAALAASVLLIGLPLLLSEYRGYSTGLARVSDLGLCAFGASLVAIAWLSGILRPLANRVRPASEPHLWLVRLAMSWMLIGGGFAVYLGLKGLIDGAEPSFLHLDALRHVLALGAVTPLIFGMGLMILPEFAAERQRTHHQAGLARLLVVLIGAAVVLRALPGVVSPEMDQDARNAMLVAAGALGEVALIVFAASFVRLLMFERRQARAAARPG